MARLKGKGCNITFHVKDFKEWYTEENLMLLNDLTTVDTETYDT